MQQAAALLFVEVVCFRKLPIALISRLFGRFSLCFPWVPWSDLQSMLRQHGDSCSVVRNRQWAKTGR
jgi:hypothetical protein